MRLKISFRLLEEENGDTSRGWLTSSDEHQAGGTNLLRIGVSPPPNIRNDDSTQHKGTQHASMLEERADEVEDSGHRVTSKHARTPYLPRLREGEVRCACQNCRQNCRYICEPSELRGKRPAALERKQVSAEGGWEKT